MRNKLAITMGDAAGIGAEIIVKSLAKKEIYDSPLCELLKDADVLARFLENPDMELKGIRKQRLLDACADIQN